LENKEGMRGIVKQVLCEKCSGEINLLSQSKRETTMEMMKRIRDKYGRNWLECLY
jgi:cytochrome c-type biogenesis protein CcmH/NrfF